MKKVCLTALLAGFLATSSSICSSDLSFSQKTEQPTVSTIENSFFTGKSWVYEHLKNIVKQTLMKISDLRESSRELRLLAEEVLRENGITQEVIILESDNLSEDAAYVQKIPPFTFLVVNSECAHDLWTLYHESGHIYYNHNIALMQKELGTGMLGLIMIFLAYRLHFLNPQRIGNWCYLLLAPVIIKILFIKYFVKQDEKEADLFACAQLLKQNKLDIVLQELLINDRIEDDWHPTNAEVREYIQKCLLDYGILQETITSYINK